MTLAPKILTGVSWEKLRQYLGLARRGLRHAVTNADQLEHFITSRASHVSQTSLYGYLKARAGTRFPELFDSPVMLESINIAKWQTWLACVSDLSVYCGGLLYRSGALDDGQTAGLMGSLADHILGETGIPPEAGMEFGESRQRFRERMDDVLWANLVDDETVFTASPAALVKWAPVVDEFRRRDREIVENSVKFRWIEVRRSARQLIDPMQVAASVEERGA